MLNKEDILALAWEYSEASGKRYSFTEQSLFEFLKELKKEPDPQPEREAFEVAHALRALADQFKEAWPEHDGKYDFLVGAGSRIARAARPAQTAQETNKI